MSGKDIVILAGESSGELYGALLANEILRRWPDAEIWGTGGERMAQSGVRLLGSLGHAFGLFEALAAINNIRRNYKEVLNHIIERRPQVIVLIDYPDFNIRIGKLAKKLGIKVLYYVSPQVWAWRKKRCFVIKEIADYIALILPFEERLYREIGARAEFVGHPVVEEIEEVEARLSQEGNYRAMAKKLLGIPEGKTVISLLPGSRPSEIKRLLPLLRETVRSMRSVVGEKFFFLMPLAPNLSGEFKSELDLTSSFGVKVLPPFLSTEHSGEKIYMSSSVVSLIASDIAIAASGTVVLQAALLGVPTIVIYRLSWLTYFIGRLIVDVKYITIPNIILDREVFPELLQKRASVENIMKNVRKFLESGASRESTRNDLLKVREIFFSKKPSKRVAEIVGELAGW
ncbi:MAG: lipid-A-disaccharide synthase [Thermodesulfovibrionales bacterium]|nr:lipid-A-disaccharide synthase [Thermodesulfovibrionales bacterium]